MGTFIIYSFICAVFCSIFKWNINFFMLRKTYVSIFSLMSFGHMTQLARIKSVQKKFVMFALHITIDMIVFFHLIRCN